MIGALDDCKHLRNLSETDNLFYIKAKLEGQELHVYLIVEYPTTLFRPN